MTANKSNDRIVWTIGSILNWTRQYFEQKGVLNPRLDAEVLLSHVLGKDRLYLYVNFEQPLNSAETAAFRELVKIRAQRVPVAYALEAKEFMGLNFKVNKYVLIPRPDTEILVEAAFDFLGKLSRDNLLVADVGTGSGAIIVSLLTRLVQVEGLATDVSPEALDVARENAAEHQVLSRLKFGRGDLFSPFEEFCSNGRKFDAILSNPPYIPSPDITGLSPEVRQEPRIALDGGDDGLDFYRRLIREAPGYLTPGGLLALEVGLEQAASVAGLAKNTNLILNNIVKDYSGIDRVLLFTTKIE